METLTSQTSNGATGNLSNRKTMTQTKKTNTPTASKPTTDGKERCAWGPRGGDLMMKYHDTEWGVPVHDDHKRFEKLISDPGIIRNRLKITAAITNAQKFLEVQEEFGTFDKYIWSFVGGRPIQNRLASMKHLPATSKESDALSKDLKQRGFKFVGSTIVYAHMQAVGMVNDHLVTCFRHKHCTRLR